MKAIDILNTHNLKRTSCREGIIDIIMTSKVALSENEIRERLSGNYDRTTFYRSFKILESSNIIHKIVINEQLVKYAIDTGWDNTQHAHFYCNNCHCVECLNSLAVENIDLPDIYKENEVEILIKGTCKNCKTNIEKN